MPLSQCLAGITRWGLDTFRAWQAGTRFRRDVGAYPAGPLSSDLSEEEWRDLDRRRLQRADDLAEAFKAGALGHTRWGQPGEFHEAQQLAVQAELERLATAPDQ